MAQRTGRQPDGRKRGGPGGSRAAPRSAPAAGRSGSAAPRSVSPPRSASAPRWRRRKDARPREIIAAALAVFAERGFAAARLDDVAARAGVTRGTLYLYFPSKEELFKEAIRRSMLPLLSRAETMAAADSAADGSAAALLRRLMDFLPGALMGSPAAAIPKLVIAESSNFPDIARFYLETVIDRGRRLIAAILRRGIARGEFRAVDVDHIVYSVMAPVLLSALWQHSFRPYDSQTIDPHALSRAHADILLHGLLAPAATAAERGDAQKEQRP